MCRLVGDLCLSGYVKKPRLHATATFLFAPEHDAELKLNALRDKAESLARALLLGVLKLRPKLLYRVGDRDVVSHRFHISPSDNIGSLRRPPAPSAWARGPGIWCRQTRPCPLGNSKPGRGRSEEHTSELQSH